MNILHSLPREDGFYMPAEFEPHEGCFLIWPERPDSWAGGAYAARKAFVKVISAIARWEKVTVFASYNQYENARASLPPQVRVVELSTDDAWARDVSPVIVKNAAGEIRGIDWGFNAWGGLYDGLYFPWDRDNHVARKACDLLDIDCYDRRDFILEGGSIHSDGEGTVMVTEECLLSPGRNPGLSREEIEQVLRDNLGAEKVLWLPYGIWGDETNGHVDNICAFTAPGEVVLAWTDDENDPQYPLSAADLDYLQRVTDAKGRKLTVHKLPIPDHPILCSKADCDAYEFAPGEDVREPGERLAASYVNFYFTNGAVLVPQFGGENAASDERACAILCALCPERRVIGLPARDILQGGGNIHCITQQIPL